MKKKIQYIFGVKFQPNKQASKLRHEKKSSWSEATQTVKKKVDCIRGVLVSLSIQRYDTFLLSKVKQDN